MKKLFYFTFLLFACETENYETGQGQYSLMQADLCELTINSQQQGTSFVTDDGDAYTAKAPYTATWIATADTTYRTLIYYNKVDNSQAEVIKASAVPTLIPREHWRLKDLQQDPLNIESAWLSKSGKYLNLVLTEDIWITRNGKLIAKMVNPNVSSVDAISGILAGKVPADADRHSLREERLSRYETND